MGTVGFDLFPFGGPENHMQMRLYKALTNQLSVGLTTLYTKLETIQRRLAWPLRKDDTQKSWSVSKFFDCFSRNTLSPHH